MITLVCGLGRCGSSLMMQMLHVGGMRTCGEWPAFEADQMRPLQESGNVINAKWLADMDGGAVKILDPHLFVLPPGSYRAIWMARNEDEQARSQLKFLKIISGLDIPSSARKPMARSLREDTPIALEVLRRVGAEVMRLRFEEVLTKDQSILDKISEFCGPLDTARMSQAVMIRNAKCEPSLEIETYLLDRKPIAAAAASHLLNGQLRG